MHPQPPRASPSGVSPISSYIIILTPPDYDDYGDEIVLNLSVEGGGHDDAQMFCQLSAELEAGAVLSVDCPIDRQFDDGDAASLSKSSLTSSLRLSPVSEFPKDGKYDDANADEIN